MNMPSVDDLMNPTLEALHALGGSASISELLEQITETEKFSAEVIEQIHPGKSNQTEVAYRLAWARTYLKIYGLIENSGRGVWALTIQGSKTKNINSKYVRRFFREQNRKNKSKVEDIEDPDTPRDPGISVGWQEALMESLLSMRPDAFERLCQRVLRESGFTQVEVTGRTGDGGIDGNGVIQLVGLLSFPVVFQCKRYSGSVSAGVIRDFRGAMVGRADKGLVITTSSFTTSAKAEATRDGAPPIDLIDGEKLMDRLKELGIGVHTRQVELIEVDKEWFENL
jgi:restriction system protein